MASEKADGTTTKVEDTNKTLPDMITHDGVLLPNFPGLSAGGPEKRFNAIRNLDTNSDDIVLATYPKSGTHWIWEIINMLLQGKTDYRRETKESLMLEMIPDLGYAEQEKSPRILNTHLPCRWLPKKHIENGWKIVHMMRNPKDVFVSMFHHLKSTGTLDKNMTWAEFLNEAIKGRLAKAYDGWFSYERDIERAKRRDNGTNIHTVQYECMKLFPEKEIRNLASFLDVSVSEDLIKEIADKCSFDKLRKADKEHPEAMKAALKKMRENKDIPIRKPPNIYRKGIIGDWKNYFTVAQNEQFDALYEKEMKDFNLDIIYESQ